MALFDLATLRRSYDRSAPTYDVRFRALQREKYATMLGPDAAALRRGGQWLDVGCGTGLLEEYLTEHGRGADPVVGVDFSRAMLEHARTRGMLATRGAFDALPFRDAAFGTVFAFTVLRILPDLAAERRAIAEAARVLERGGLFIVTVLRANHDAILAQHLRAAGFEPESPVACGQDVGYRCVRA